ncbi:hypothetical protein [Methanosarcina sp. UBA289]|uniref:hypothetical protein n=1 Tax=Methanosarcina sp. UBA289 TaxID=1915574 RepID=UPI0025FF55C4|nr:hypothetical protein [Methanosarcina sp. UBA289]
MKKQGGSSRKPCLQKCHYLFFEDLFKTRSTFGHFGEVTVVGFDSSQPKLEEGNIERENYG